MRIHLITTRTKKIIPFNYQSILTGALHKWTRRNTVHDEMSLYSFSWLQGGEPKKNGLAFHQGASYFISSSNDEFIKILIQGIKSDPNIAFDLKVQEITIQEDPAFKNAEKFHAASPIFIRRHVDGKDIHYTFREKESNKFLTETLKNKLKKAGINNEGIDVSFDDNYPNAKTKIISYNDIGSKVNICPVIIKGSPKQIAFAWNVGVGNSTGIGFGALK